MGAQLLGAGPVEGGDEFGVSGDYNPSYEDWPTGHVVPVEGQEGIPLLLRGGFPEEMGLTRGTEVSR